jgi:hypothetical protein
MFSRRKFLRDSELFFQNNQQEEKDYPKLPLKGNC